MSETTRWGEEKIGYDDLVWVCEKCGFTTLFECDGPEELDYNFCPRCGCWITEYVKHKDPLEVE